jgi:hypothetical protein
MQDKNTSQAAPQGRAEQPEQRNPDTQEPRPSQRATTSSVSGVSGAVIPHADLGEPSPVQPRDPRFNRGALGEEEQQDPNVRSGTGL